MDLLTCNGTQKHEYEFKHTDHPRVSKSMYSAIEDLELTTLSLIIPGKLSFKIHDSITVVGLDAMSNRL